MHYNDTIYNLLGDCLVTNCLMLPLEFALSGGLLLIRVCLQAHLLHLRYKTVQPVQKQI